MTAFEKIISDPAVGSLSALARHFSVTPWAVSKWSKSIPAKRCPAIERLCEARVRCEDMRPDIDWAALRG